MNSAKIKPILEVNLEEFERRLRAAVAPQAGVEDPLAELTRLVDTIGLDRTPAARQANVERALRPKPELRLATPPAAPEPEEAPAAPEPAAQALPPLPEPASEPLPPLAEAMPTLRPSFDAEDLDSHAIEPPPPSSAEPEEESQFVEPPAAAAPPRARNWGVKVGGLIAAAAVMTGAVVVFKVGAHHAGNGGPPLILASSAPTKAPPPSAATVRTANENGALLTRDSAQPTPTPPKLVNTPEAPVDLAARPSAPVEAAPSASVSATTLAPAASPSQAAAAAQDSPVAANSDTPILAAAPSPDVAMPASDDPSRVKTISVRPDGSLISSGFENAAPPAPPAAEPAVPPPPAASLKEAAADAEPSTPAVALPTKLAPPKAAERVVAKTPTTAPADAGSGPAPTAPKGHKPKHEADKPKAAADAEPVNSDDAVAPSGGGYAVQLAAPKSESEAHALVKRFKTRFADAIGGAALGVRKADRHGEAIYRVRVLGLSKPEAAAMCAKVKASGGDCYVAKN